MLFAEQREYEGVSGYAFYLYKGECRLRVNPKSEKKMQDKIRELMERSNEYRKKKLQ